jgi:hypothetical protein
MTRDDYREIVRIIRKLERGETKRLMWAHAFAGVLKRDNSRFSEKSFLAAVMEKNRT